MRDHYVGVDLGGTKILSGVFSLDGRPRGRDKRATPFEGSAADLLAAIGDSIQGALADASLSSGRVVAIGAGCPGPIDPDRGLILRTPNILARRVPVARVIGRRFGCPVVLDNDVHMALRGEWLRGAGKGHRNLVGLWIGTGIGGGVICDGRLVTGINRNAGELGHMIVDAARAQPGTDRGSLEWEASKSAMARRLRRGMRSGSRPRRLFQGGRLHSGALADAYRAGDRLAADVVEHSARYVGIAVANLFDALAPEIFILGGGVVEDIGAAYVRLVRRSAIAHAYSTELAKPRVAASKLGEAAGTIGAALAAREAHPPRHRAASR